MAENLNAVKPKRQRWRLAKSCEPCRARKVKCDRGLPCRTCLRSRASLSCTYNPEPDRRPSDSPSPNLPSSADKTSAASSSASRNEYANAFQDLSLSSLPQNGTTESIAQKIGRLERAFEDPEATRGKAPIYEHDLKSLEVRISRIEEHLTADGRAEIRRSDPADLKISLPRPHLRSDREKTRLFGKTHWVHSLDAFNLIRQMQSTTESLANEAPLDVKADLADAKFIRSRANTIGPNLIRDPMPSFRGTIPVRGVCDEALDGYLRTYEPMFRVLHIPSFMSEYERHWASPESSTIAFHYKLSMILTIGAVFLKNRAIANEIRGAAREWIYAVQWWLTGPTERDAMSIEGVQIFCLLVLARQVNALGGTASILTEALPKLAFTMGLHLNARFLPAMTPVESELRRRLWVTVLELTTITSLNSTLPLLVSLDDSLARMPSNLEDSALPYNSGSDATRTPIFHERLDCSIQLLLAKSLRLRMQVVKELNDTSGEASYQKVLETTNALKVHCREVAAFFQNRQAPASPLSFHQKFIDCYLRRLILFLNRPFALQSRNDQRFFLSRKDSLESCLVMASYTEHVSVAEGIVDDYTYSCMAGGGMFKGPLGPDVICAVSMEVVTQLEEEGVNDPRQADGQATDPLALLSRSNRKPLLDYLYRSVEQWRQNLILGRASMKQFLFLQGILAHIETIQAGGEGDIKTAIMDNMAKALKECINLIRYSPMYQAVSDTGSFVTDNTSPQGIDPMTFFGFDFSALEPDSAEWNVATGFSEGYDFS